MKPSVSIFWFRRDLRLDDNAGLYHALKSGSPVLPIFIFDRHILDMLEDRDDARVTFLHKRLGQLKTKLAELGAHLEVRYGTPEQIWQQLLRDYQVSEVFTNRDYEPYAKQRDTTVKQLLSGHDVPLHHFKDHVIFEADEVQKQAGGAYTVFTPYSRQWIAKLDTRGPVTDKDKASSFYLQSYPTQRYFSAFAKTSQLPVCSEMPSLEDMGFRESDLDYPAPQPDEAVIASYDKTRNYPAIPGTTQLGVHLRHGTISIRRLAERARGLNAVYLSELIWRDFYSQVLQTYPHVVEHAYRPEYDEIQWLNDESHFQAWCDGQTGYPLVDAGMRELNSTGYMHNRVRMVTASFLTKHLLTDWRWGERYFARKLLDYDLASNNGGWQWAAGTGADASPYFRVFNPESQLKKFDRQHAYVKQWVPEYGTDEYVAPIVDHKMARQRAIDTYKSSLAAARGQST